MIAVVGAAQTVPRSDRRQDLRPVLAVAAGRVAFHLAVSGRYGFHRDELYYIAAGRQRLSATSTTRRWCRCWPWSPTGSAPTCGRCGRCGNGARRTGRADRAHGPRPGRRTAGGAAGRPGGRHDPAFVASGSLFQTVVFDQMWWALVLLAVVRLLAGADPRWWLAVGAAVGLGLETKWTMAVLVAGLAVGLAACPRAGPSCAPAGRGREARWRSPCGCPTSPGRRSTAGRRSSSPATTTPRCGPRRGGSGSCSCRCVGRPLAPVPLVGAGVAAWLWARQPWRALCRGGHRRLPCCWSWVASLHLGPLYVVGIAAGYVATEGWLAAAPHR